MVEMLKLDLVTPERLVSSDDVYMAVVPGDEGEFGVLAGHAPLISSIRPGVIDMYGMPGDVKPFDRVFVSGGFAEVTGERCTVLATEAMRVKDIDKSDVEDRLKNAQKAFDKAETGAEKRKAQEHINVAKAMLQL